MSVIELVDRLRSDELAQVASEVRAGRTETILKALDERGRASELVQQQYTGRYPFELLQNADDAAALAGPGRVRFVATEQALVVGDNGAGFGPDQVRAICGLGRSSKDPAKSIGNKGLGFKSVGEITDRPQILSGDAAFGFDTAQVRMAVEAITGSLPEHQRLPVYAFPMPVTSQDLGDDLDVIDAMRADGFTTMLRLPFRADVTQTMVRDHLEATLAPRLLLFLKATEQLEVHAGTLRLSAFSTREAGGVADDVLIETGGEVEHWRTYRREVPVEQRDLVAPLGDLWAQVERVTVAAAIPMGAHGRPTRTGPFPLHVYFPSQEATGLSYILHGDFALELDRRRVSRSPQAAPYNDWLAHQVADLIAGTVAPDLAQTSGAAAALTMAPIAPSSEFGANCQALVIDRLKTSPFINCRDDRIRRPAEALLLPPSIPHPAEAHHHLREDRVRRLVAPAIEVDQHARQLLRDHLDVTELSTPECLAELRLPPSSAEALFEFLVPWSDVVRTDAFAAHLADLVCVPLTDGRWVAPSSGAYLPGERDEVTLPPELPVDIAAVPDVVGAAALLEAAGVHGWGWRDIILGTVLPLLTDPDASEARRAGALEVLRAYRRSPRSGDQTIATQVGRVLLPARRAAPDGRGEPHPASSVYFPASWLGHGRLEAIYGPFGQHEFLDIDAPDDSEQRDDERSFLAWLGVADSPRLSAVITSERDRYMLDSAARHPHSRIQPWWSEWRERPDVQAAARCPHGHPASQQLRASFALDRAAEIIDAADPALPRALWDELAYSWATAYQPAMTAVFHCQHGDYHGDRDRHAPSLLAHMLEASTWVPCHRRARPVLAQPRHAWRLAADTPHRLVEHVAVLPAELTSTAHAPLIAALGVVDAARPSADDLIELLKDLSHTAEGGDAPSRSLMDSARWAMRNLNDALDTHSAARTDGVPLLARRGGQSFFTSTPVVADDPLLADTFHDEYAILDADRGLTRLHAALTLRILDNEVKVTPVPRQPLHDEATRIRDSLQRANAYLVALAATEVPSRTDDVVRGLASLEIVVCADLAIRYEFNGSTRERDEAVSYIAVRVEQGSRRRRIGTAHLEIESSNADPDWYTFGRQLAEFLRVPTLGDAFAIILTSDATARRRFLASHHVGDDALDEARVRLHEPPPEDIPDPALDAGLLVAASDDDQPAIDEVPPVDAHPDAGSSDEESAGGEQELPPLPPIDPATVQFIDATAGVPFTPQQRHTVPGTSLGPAGPVDHASGDNLRRLIGRRGEEAVFDAERRRIEALGFDPDSVVWRSASHAFAPYDIESLDSGGQRIFIEVKATTDPDPAAPFEISAAELQYAMRTRSRYSIYRVCDADTSSPVIVCFPDPMRWLSEGIASLTVSGARMRFAVANADEGLDGEGGTADKADA